jgi:hypothetical protein
VSGDEENEENEGVEFDAEGPAMELMLEGRVASES